MADSHKTPNMYPNLNISPNDHHFRLNKISEIKDYFVAENKRKKINEQKT